MRFVNALVSILLAVALIAGATMDASAQAVGRMSGKVVNEEGEPIRDVQITVTSEALPTFEQKLETNKKGKFTLAVPDATKTYQLYFSADGYRPLKEESVKLPIGDISFETFTMLTPQAVAETVPAEPIAEGGEQPERPPANPALAAYNEAVHAFRNQDYALAETKVQEALDLNDNLADARALLAVINLEQDEYQQAVEAADRALELAPDDFKALTVRYRAFTEMGDEAKAEEARDHLRRLGDATDVAKSIYNEGVDALESEDFDLAIGKFNEALSLDETLDAAHWALATLYQRQGDWVKAASEAQKVIAVDANNEDARSLYYEAVLRSGQVDKVPDAARALLAVDAERSAPIMLRQAETFFDNDQSALAAAILAPVVEAQPDLAQAHYVLGLAYLNQGKIDQAKQEFETFIEMAPNDPNAASARALTQRFE